MFLIMFNTRHALPLRSRRILSPRNGRGLVAEYPRDCPAIWPRPCTVRVRIQDATSPHPHRDRDRVQSVPVFFPESHPRPQRVHVHVRVQAAIVPITSKVTTASSPQSVHSHAQSVATAGPRSSPDRDRDTAANWPDHSRRLSALPTAQIRSLFDL